MRLWALIAMGLPMAPRAFEQPQYVCLNKMYGCAGSDTCWNENQPATFTQASVDAMLSSVAGKRGASASRRLCIGYQFDVLDGSSTDVKLRSLSALMDLSMANDLPIMVTVDAFEFWQGAPDLWNWWNSTLPGFEPANVANVEWTSWSSANATAIAWCNWGSQFRKAPHPNLASPAFRQRAKAAMMPLAAALAQWYGAVLLPSGRGYLLAGVKCSWEAWIGTNYYFYPGGNGLVNSPSTGDPTTGVSGSVQLGYAALCSIGARGGAPADCGLNASRAPAPLTGAQVDLILNEYLEFVGGVVADAGVPRHKLFTHAGSFFGAPPTATIAFNSPSASITARSRPGWSLYGKENPDAYAGLSAALDRLGLPVPWGATEWLYTGGNPGTPLQQWVAAFNNTLNWRNNRLVDVFNVRASLPSFALAGCVPPNLVPADRASVVLQWEFMGATAQQAAAIVLDEAPRCLVDSPGSLKAARLHKSAWALTWTAAVDAQSLQLQAASQPSMLPSGLLAAPDLAVQELDGQANGTVLALPGFPGERVYWTVVAVGCERAQAAVAPVAFIEWALA